MKREPLSDQSYFEDNIAHYKGIILEHKATIATQPPDIKRWDFIYAFLYSAQFRVFFNQYSAGITVDGGMAELVREGTETFITYLNHKQTKEPPLAKSFHTYEQCLTILSLNLIFKSSRALVTKLMTAVDTLGKDKLLDRMAAYIIPDRQISATLAWAKPYEALYAVFDAKKEDRPGLMRAYLKNWYKSMRKTPWYGSHKDTEGSMFYGYWSFESAATTQLLEIDDRDYRDMAFYPKDLLHAQLKKYMFT